MLKAFLDFCKINNDDACLNEEDKEMLSKLDNKDSNKMNIEDNWENIIIYQMNHYYIW